MSSPVSHVSVRRAAFGERRAARVGSWRLSRPRRHVASQYSDIAAPVSRFAIIIALAAVRIVNEAKRALCGGDGPGYRRGGKLSRRPTAALYCVIAISDALYRSVKKAGGRCSILVKSN